MSLAAQKLAEWPALLLLVVMIAACSGPAPQPSPHTFVARIETTPSVTAAGPAKTPGLIALEAARKMLGTSYRYGGADPRGFDCSGLVQYSFSYAGVTLPRTSQDIFRSSQQVNPQDLQPGDLVFFAISPSKVSHVGIYEGRNRFIHSPSSGKGVSYADLDEPYWRERLIGIRRF